VSQIRVQIAVAQLLLLHVVVPAQYRLTKLNVSPVCRCNAQILGVPGVAAHNSERARLQTVLCKNARPDAHSCDSSPLWQHKLDLHGCQCKHDRRKVRGACSLSFPALKSFHDKFGIVVTPGQR